jgi:hypothetical protein
MKDREKRYTNDLERCRANIDKTKGLIDYHRDMLKKLEKKETCLISKLDKVKMAALCDVINKGGYDIDSLRNAVATGDFESVSSKVEAAVIPEKSELKAIDEAVVDTIKTKINDNNDEEKKEL